MFSGFSSVFSVAPRAGKPTLVLAPMEGVIDAPMRELLTRRGSFSYGVSEFIRVTYEVPPAKVFLRDVPELRSGAPVTPGGLPIQIQILGGHPEAMAAAALVACSAGARAIDINFGCPAPTVNRHDGGATLLKFPDRIRAIVSAVRKAVAPEIPVSVKLRLGWDNSDDIHFNADRAAEGGASWIAIHGRTKVQGYAPPADWTRIGEVRRRMGGDIPVIANGDLWTREDFLRCRDATGCEHFMIGRGALADLTLSRQIAAELGMPVRATKEATLAEVAREFVGLAREFTDRPGYPLQRLKQWLSMANRHRVGGLPVFERLKKAQTLDEALALLDSDRGPSGAAGIPA